MQTFHYFPPGEAEQREFLMQLLGTVISLALILALGLWKHDPMVRGLLWGSAAAVIWMMVRSALRLEMKAQRSEKAAVGIDEVGLHVTDPTGKTSTIGWEEISECAVVGGRLAVTWPAGKLVVGARELEDGMTLVREVTKQWVAHKNPGQFQPPSNFIPLEPR